MRICVIPASARIYQLLTLGADERVATLCSVDKYVYKERRQFFSEPVLQEEKRKKLEYTTLSVQKNAEEGRSGSLVLASSSETRCKINKNDAKNETCTRELCTF
jgi:hypothetical protein